MLQSHNYTDPFDSKAVLAFLTLVGIAFCEFVPPPSWAFFKAWPFWSSHVAIASNVQGYRGDKRI